MKHALLLTDVVDSTMITEKLGDTRMTEIWMAHDRAVRDLLSQFRGREVDRTDGFLVLFDSVADAVAFAAECHRAMRAMGTQFGLDFRVRVGIHFAQVILIETSESDRRRGAKPFELEGVAKPLAARVMSLARGGQTLLTSEARENLGDQGGRVMSHGHWRLKGVAAPMELFEVGDDLAPYTPPEDTAKVYRVVWEGNEWTPAREIPYHLPREHDAFVGREADLQQLAKLLEDGAALVSVLGIGGTGKTRLVTRYAWAWRGDYPGGAWFCDLADARDIPGIAAGVARGLEIPLGPDPMAQLSYAIAGHGRCLIVLDNFEQIARWANDTIGRWLEAAPEAQFIVTTREVLGLRGETTLALAPMTSADGVTLFETRAAKVRGKPDETDADRALLEELVRMLDGLPLAIELAAARARLLSPKALLERLGERFKLLASPGGRRDRQATLRAALDWSWELLSPVEQEALTQLSVFEGGFTIEAAEGVLDLSDQDQGTWTIDVVQALVDKSLVRPTSANRFGLLVSVQEYAYEKLADRDSTRLRHATWFAKMGSPDAMEALDFHGGVEKRRALAPDVGNLVAACRHTIELRRQDLALATLRAAWQVLQFQGPFALGAALAEAVIGLAPPDAAGNRARFFIGCILDQIGRADQGRPLLEMALQLTNEADDPRAAGRLRVALANLDVAQDRTPDATTRMMQAVTISHNNGDRWAEGSAWKGLANAHRFRGNLSEAERCFQAALKIHREIGNRSQEATSMCDLALVYADQGRRQLARSFLEASLAAIRELGDLNTEATTLSNLGALNMEEGRFDEARKHLSEALAMQRAIGGKRVEALILANLGELELREGKLDSAHARYQASLEALKVANDRRVEAAVYGQLGNLNHLLGRPREARASFATAEPMLRTIGDPIELGKLLCSRAVFEHQQGDAATAARLLSEAQEIAAGLAAGPDSALSQEIAKARAATANK